MQKANCFKTLEGIYTDKNTSFNVCILAQTMIQMLPECMYYVLLDLVIEKVELAETLL